MTTPLPPIVQALVDAPYGAKAWVARHDAAWRYYAGACRRFGWNGRCLGWYAAKNGPFTGIRIEALHTNHLWVPAGLYEPAVARCLVGLLEDPAIAAGEMWDIGANRGLIALLGARHGASRVVAIELSPENVAQLERELAANPDLALRIEIVHAAISDADGEVSIAIDGHDSAVCQIVAPGVQEYEHSPGTTVQRCTARAIDSLAAERGSRIGLLKIDVEGAEALVLAGASRVLRVDAPAVVMEVHNEEAGRDATAILRRAGYQCRRLDANGALRPLGEVVGYGHVIARADS